MSRSRTNVRSDNCAIVHAVGGGRWTIFVFSYSSLLEVQLRWVALFFKSFKNFYSLYNIHFYGVLSENILWALDICHLLICHASFPLIAQWFSCVCDLVVSKPYILNLPQTRIIDESNNYVSQIRMHRPFISRNCSI